MKELLAYINLDPQTRDGIINITSWLAMLVYFLFLDIFVVPIAVPQNSENYGLYLFVLFAPAATRLIFFSGEPILYKKDPEATFFQNQLPDKHVAKRWNLPLDAARDLWFKAYRRKETDELNLTYKYGHTCRLVYYTWRITAFFALLAIFWLFFQLIIAFHYTTDQNACWCDLKTLGKTFLSIHNWEGKVLYLFHVSVIAIYLRMTNIPDEKNPTGIWALWRDINAQHKAWIDDTFKSEQEFRDFATKPQIPAQAPAAAPKNE